MKLIKSPKYIFYSFIGFILYVLCTLTIDKISYQVRSTDAVRRAVTINYFIAEGIICGLLAFILSFIILYFFEKLIDFGNLKKLALWKMIGVFSIVQFLYSLCLWPLLNMAMVYFFGKAMPLTFAMRLTNIPYFAAIFIIWMFVVITITLYNYISQVKISKIELESNLRESQLNTLKGQINPHFMFNSLNNIRGLVLEDTARSREMITRLSEMLRYSLTKNNVNTISIKEELQTVDNYIALSKIQFEERLKFTSEVSAEATNLLIPPMIIQMMVENAVKHGIGTIKEGGAINLKIETEDSNLIICVANSGSLTINEGTTKLGLENIKKRLSLLFGDKAGFTLQESGNFVVAQIIIPL